MTFRSVDPNQLDWSGVSIELSEGGVRTGRINDPGFIGLGSKRVAMPTLLAHRPEASRFFRLARIVGAARAFALSELGPDGPALLDAALVSILDSKGDFDVIWRSRDQQAALEVFIAKAVALEGERPEDQICHFQ